MTYPLKNLIWKNDIDKNIVEEVLHNFDTF